ncbi:hypothetical protein [Bacillus cereus]|uniref:hypothetical protein n=1 Tax=Bacillus cereus TaxID=1396 RepID=UPI000995DE04|nr:hypothetical protein [Bacillus cereus]OPA07532.1 hypothetical protein BHL54_25230 [Bacillus cereus]
MSLPNIPNITPCISLTRHEAINLLLSSIAMEEIGLSHILNAEGEKLQHFLKIKHLDVSKYIAMNKSVNDTLRTIVKSQMLLQLKLEEVNSIAECEHRCTCVCEKSTLQGCRCKKNCCKQNCNTMCKKCNCKNNKL